MTIKAIVTDIEGTTGSISFVHETLFPYARTHLPDFIREHATQPAIAEQLDAVRQEIGQPDANTETVIEQLLNWIAEDKKITPLKALQGLVWENGYKTEAYKGHLYPDAFQKLSDWQQQGIRLFIYSSGSVYAQKLLFGYSDFGDLNHLFEGNFDTLIGGKKDVASYQAIAEQLDLPAQEILFLSDVIAELDAAQAAGLKTTHLIREPGMETGEHPQVSRFDQIDLTAF
ncbi:acireductone synthase [Oceanospirillum sediminis]|uniref:Enolase-phosphatase E1 n=1 Tax=Oceanospirillum sediminis TaxID=2760088 RepID=A0A839ISX9_9GAMM|nr:acireductone synthase [Oceanospirillum sediminis]MBB1488425.1 acireductone synthase [Oceanospirillum sediminis]